MQHINRAMAAQPEPRRFAQGGWLDQQAQKIGNAVGIKPGDVTLANTAALAGTVAGAIFDPTGMGMVNAINYAGNNVSRATGGSGNMVGDTAMGLGASKQDAAGLGQASGVALQIAAIYGAGRNIADKYYGGAPAAPAGVDANGSTVATGATSGAATAPTQGPPSTLTSTFSPQSQTTSFASQSAAPAALTAPAPAPTDLPVSQVQYTGQMQPVIDPSTHAVTSGPVVDPMTGGFSKAAWAASQAETAPVKPGVFSGMNAKDWAQTAQLTAALATPIGNLIAGSQPQSQYTPTEHTTMVNTKQFDPAKRGPWVPDPISPSNPNGTSGHYSAYGIGTMSYGAPVAVKQTRAQGGEIKSGIRSFAAGGNTAPAQMTLQTAPAPVTAAPYVPTSFGNQTAPVAYTPLAAHAAYVPPAVTAAPAIPANLQALTAGYAPITGNAAYDTAAAANVAGKSYSQLTGTSMSAAPSTASTVGTTTTDPNGMKIVNPYSLNIGSSNGVMNDANALGKMILSNTADNQTTTANNATKAATPPNSKINFSGSPVTPSANSGIFSTLTSPATGTGGVTGSAADKISTGLGTNSSTTALLPALAPVANAINTQITQPTTNAVSAVGDLVTAPAASLSTIVAGTRATTVTNLAVKTIVDALPTPIQNAIANAPPIISAPAATISTGISKLVNSLDPFGGSMGLTSQTTTPAPLSTTNRTVAQVGGNTGPAGSIYNDSVGSWRINADGTATQVPLTANYVPPAPVNAPTTTVYGAAGSGYTPGVVSTPAPIVAPPPTPAYVAATPGQVTLSASQVGSTTVNPGTWITRNGDTYVLNADGTATLASSLGYAAGGQIKSYAQGGPLHHGIGSLPQAGQYLKGPGDGMSDDIPAYIDGGGIKAHEPIRVASGEYVISADVVSNLGNGSSDAGARALDAMMDRIRKQKHGTTKQPKAVDPRRVLPA